jgi:hypothetical protein
MNREKARETQARFWSKLAGLIGGGVPWVDAFGLAGRAVEEDPDLFAAIARVVERMRNGDAPSDALADEDGFSDEVVRTVRAGEEMGDLEVKAEHLAEQIRSGAFAVGRAAMPPEETEEALAEILESARAAGATHVHFLPHPGGGKVRRRVGGRLDEGRVLPPEEFEGLLRALPDAGNLETGDGPVRVSRVAFREGPGATLRLTPPPEEEIRISGGDLETVRPWLDRLSGLVLVAGRPAAAREALLSALVAPRLATEKVCVLGDGEGLPGALNLPAETDLASVLDQDPDLLVLARVPGRAAAHALLRAAERVPAIAVVPVDRAVDAVSVLAALGPGDRLACVLVGAVAVRVERGRARVEAFEPREETRRALASGVTDPRDL